MTNTNDTPLFKSSPERIGLAFGDGSDDLWQMEFDDLKDVTWYSGTPQVSVTIEYVRADLYENLKVESDSFADDVEKSNRKNLSSAMACVRDDGGITVGGALNRQREMIGELRAELAAANERAEALQRTINEALSQSPAATIVEIDDGLGTTFLEFNEPRGPAGTNYYAAPVPAQPAVVPEGLANAVLANIAAIAHCGGLAKLDNENALSNIRQLSKPWCDNTGTLRDLKNRVDAAIAASKGG